MKRIERRTSRRYILNVPVRIGQLAAIGESHEPPGQTLNVSRTGILMTSPLRLEVGSQLHLTLQVPMEISGSAVRRFRCNGRVVREEKLADGTIGYGIEIEPIQSSARILSTRGNEVNAQL